jgi:hypothetical protein
VSKKNRPSADLPGFADQPEAGSSHLPGASAQPRFIEYLEQYDQDAGFQVGEYPLERIVPDFYQSRGGVLPRPLSFDILVGKLSHGEALQRWQEELVVGTPQHQRYLELVGLKDSIRANGLLHPIHLYKDRDKDTYVILAGERRYWAFWMLRLESGEYVRIPAVLHAEASRFLQIAENEEVAPLSIVGRVRQAALGYLELLGVRPPAQAPLGDVEYWTYYRQALLGAQELLGQKRLPDNFWAQLEERLGMHRVSILGFLELMNLPDESLNLADTWLLNQSQLSALLTVPGDVQNQIVRLVTTYDLPGPEIKRLARLAHIPGRSAYQNALRELAKAGGDEEPVKHRRRQRPPIEVHMSRMFTTFRGLQKLTGGDYRGLARLIAGNHPQEAGRLAGQLEAAAAAIRAELGAMERGKRQP